MIEFTAKCGLEWEVRPGEEGFVNTGPCPGKKRFMIDEEDLKREDAWLSWTCPKCGTSRDVITMYKNSMKGEKQ